MCQRSAGRADGRTVPSPRVPSPRRFAAPCPDAAPEGRPARRPPALGGLRRTRRLAVPSGSALGRLARGRRPHRVRGLPFRRRGQAQRPAAPRPAAASRFGGPRVGCRDAARRRHGIPDDHGGRRHGGSGRRLHDRRGRRDRGAGGRHPRQFRARRRRQQQPGEPYHQYPVLRRRSARGLASRRGVRARAARSWDARHPEAFSRSRRHPDRLPHRPPAHRRGLRTAGFARARPLPGRHLRRGGRRDERAHRLPRPHRPRAAGDPHGGGPDRSVARLPRVSGPPRHRRARHWRHRVEVRRGRSRRARLSRGGGSAADPGGPRLGGQRPRRRGRERPDHDGAARRLGAPPAADQAAARTVRAADGAARFHHARRGEQALPGRGQRHGGAVPHAGAGHRRAAPRAAGEALALRTRRLWRRAQQLRRPADPRAAPPGRGHCRVLPPVADVRNAVVRLGARRDRARAGRGVRRQRPAHLRAGHHRPAGLARPAHVGHGRGSPNGGRVARQPLPPHPDADREIVPDCLERRARLGARRRAGAPREGPDHRAPADQPAAGVPHRRGRRRAGRPAVRGGFAALVGAVVACRASAPFPVSAGLPEAYAPVLGFDSAGLAGVVAYVRGQADSGAFPGAVLAVGRHGRLALLAAVGRYGTDDARPVDPGTLYDLASLPKVVGLTTACMQLVDEGRLALDAPVQRYLPEFHGGADKERVTVRHLLTHSSGLPAWRPLYREAGSRSAALALVDTTPLATAPGERFVYSDLGAIVLTQVVERISGEPLDRLLARRVFGPLGMAATRYRPPTAWRNRIAPTETDTAFRHRALRGEVHDENAGRLGGVSGHAGLFSNALDVSRFAAMLLAGGAWDSLQLIRAETVAEFTRRQEVPPGSSRALGWDTPADSGYTSAGAKLSRRAFGHTGFTGTSLWMDPDRDLFIILLTNRVHPTRAKTAILRVRPRVADLVVDALTHPEL